MPFAQLLRTNKVAARSRALPEAMPAAQSDALVAQAAAASRAR